MGSSEGTLLHIGEASRQTGVSSKMIRHYEGLGLLPPAPRTDGGYRLYNEDTLHTLHFIRRARDLGFGMADIAVGTGAHRWLNMPVARAARPNLQRWYEAIAARPAARPALPLPVA